MTAMPPILPRPPRFRVLVRKSFGADEDPTLSGTGWSLLAERDLAKGGATSGYELIDVHPRALPDVGTASFRFVYGRFAGMQINQPADWRLHEVRIQLAPRRDVDPAPTDWVTVFWGHIQASEDRVLPGSKTPMGCRVYHCVDGLARTLHWPMDRYGFVGDVLNSPITEAYGHPGYNYQMSAEGPVLGNRATDEAGAPITYLHNGMPVQCHCWQGAFSAVTVSAAQKTWTEREAINNAFAAARPSGEPLFQLTGDGASNFDIASPMPVTPGEPLMGFLSRRARRQRGQGAIYLAFEDQGDHGTNSALKVWLDCCPATKDGRIYAFPGGAAVITGASAAGKVWPIVDLTGDIRADDSGFELSDAAMHMVDVVETLGEPIEVAVTLSYQDQAGGTSGTDRTLADIYDPAKQYSLAPRWTTDERDAFEAASFTERIRTFWDFVYQSHGLPRSWGGEVGDGFNGTKCHADYRCGGDGKVIVPPSGNVGSTASCQVELLGYVPFFEGYDYSGASAVRTSNAPQYGQPNRRPCALYLRASGDQAQDRWFLPFGELPATMTDKFYTSQVAEWQPTISVQADGFMLMSQAYTDRGLRIIADTIRESALGDNALGAIYDASRIAITLGLRLPHRVRMATKRQADGSQAYVAGEIIDARRRKIVEVPNLHLWLAHPGCIWDLDQSDIHADHGWKPMRAACGATTAAPGVLRDDRPRLAFYHALAAEWYLNERRRAKWSLNCCGIIADVIDQTSGEETVETFPKVGNLIDQIDASGALRTVGTAVTAIDYDHQAQRTTWQTDFFDLEFSA